jgi:hypothetical protein
LFDHFLAITPGFLVYAALLLTVPRTLTHGLAIAAIATGLV